MKQPNYVLVFFDVTNSNSDPNPTLRNVDKKKWDNVVDCFPGKMIEFEDGRKRVIVSILKFFYPSLLTDTNFAVITIKK